MCFDVPLSGSLTFIFPVSVVTHANGPCRLGGTILCWCRCVWMFVHFVSSASVAVRAVDLDLMH